MMNKTQLIQDLIDSTDKEILIWQWVESINVYRVELMQTTYVFDKRYLEIRNNDQLYDSFKHPYLATLYFAIQKQLGES